MATISCTPADLAAAAKCFQCLPSEQKQWIDTYLLAVIAKGSTDPNTLALAAKCFQCIPSGMLRRIQAWLLCQIVSSGGGGTVQDMQVAWTPTNVKLGEELGFFTFGDIPGITSITFNQATSIAGFDIESTTAITSLSWPNITSIDLLNTQGGYVRIDSNATLTSISFPLLNAIGGGNFAILNNPLLTSLSVPSFASAGASLFINSNTSLVAISLPALTTVTGAFLFTGNTSLTTLSTPVYLPTNGSSISGTNCALSATSVNNMLHRCVLQPTWGNAGESIDLSGGTNAAPSGQGIADKATLIGRGATVTTN